MHGALKNKITELCASLESTQPDIFGITETWLTVDDVVIEPIVQSYNYVTIDMIVMLDLIRLAVKEGVFSLQ